MKIKILATRERMKYCRKDDLTVLVEVGPTIEAFVRGDFRPFRKYVKALRNVLAVVMVDPKTFTYYPVKIVEHGDEIEFKPPADALAILNRLSLNDLKECFLVLSEQMKQWESRK